MDSEFCTTTAAPASHTFTGLIFDQIRYPTVDELSYISLKELINFRPSRLYGFERDHFFSLFSRHPEVAAINLKEMPLSIFIREWVNLWLRCNLGPASKKVCNTIKEYLSRDVTVSPELKEAIVKRHAQVQNAIMQQKVRDKRRSEDPKQMLLRQRRLERQTRYNAERRKYSVLEWRQMGADQFKEMLERNQIAIDLPAIELEEKCRHLRSELGGTHKTTTSFRNFLSLRSRPKEERGVIEIALQTRKDHNRSLAIKAYNDRQALMRLRQRQRRKGVEWPVVALHASEVHPNVAREQLISTGDGAMSLQRLLRSSRWWIPL